MCIRDSQITQAAVDIADVGHREALVLLTLVQLLPQQIQRIVVGSRLAAVGFGGVTVRCTVVDVDGSHAGYLRCV